MFTNISVVIFLNVFIDLRKRTPQDLKDYKKLEEAKKILDEVLQHINEDKRKTESKTKIFDIVYEVSVIFRPTTRHEYRSQLTTQ